MNYHTKAKFLTRVRVSAIIVGSLGFLTAVWGSLGIAWGAPDWIWTAGLAVFLSAIVVAFAAYACLD